MTGPFERWRRNPWLWIPPLGFCLLNAFGLVVYRSNFAGNVESLEGRNLVAEDQLAAYRVEIEEREAFLLGIDDQKNKIDSLYGEFFETEEERFTRAINEVKKRAREAGLNPTSWGYPRRKIEQSELVKRGIDFSVQGSYQELRTFINFLEVNEQFLVLESITLSDAGAGRNQILNINLSLSTIFVGSEAENAEDLAT